MNRNTCTHTLHTETFKAIRNTYAVKRQIQGLKINTPPNWLTITLSQLFISVLSLCHTHTFTDVLTQNPEKDTLTVNMPPAVFSPTGCRRRRGDSTAAAQKRYIVPSAILHLVTWNHLYYIIYHIISL